MYKKYGSFYDEHLPSANSTSKVIELYDLHLKDLAKNADKTYTLVLVEDTHPNVVPEERFEVFSYYGRFGYQPSISHQGRFPDLATAHRVMINQLNAKRKKGYKDVNHYLDEDAKASATGALGSKVISFLRETYPEDSIVMSPTGMRGEVITVRDDGTLTVDVEGRVMDIPFGNYGALKVIP